MLIAVGEAISSVLYDAFVAKFDFWLVFGVVAQLLFAARFLVQWISSEKAGKSVIPFAFWLFSILGAVTVAGFALSRSEGGSLIGDLLMIAAILLCGLGYAEGAALSRRLGGWQVISWALLLSLPVMATIGLFTLPGSWDGVGMPAWIGLAYVSVFSMLVGFIFWYRGLALGGIAGVGQLQLLQPFFGLILAALLLHEPIAWTMVASCWLSVMPSTNERSILRACTGRLFR